VKHEFDTYEAKHCEKIHCKPLDFFHSVYYPCKKHNAGSFVKSFKNKKGDLKCKDCIEMAFPLTLHVVRSTAICACQCEVCKELNAAARKAQDDDVQKSFKLHKAGKPVYIETCSLCNWKSPHGTPAKWDGKYPRMKGGYPWEPCQHCKKLFVWDSRTMGPHPKGGCGCRS
jgi:hypothetical protein